MVLKARWPGEEGPSYSFLSCFPLLSVRLHTARAQGSEGRYLCVVTEPLILMSLEWLCNPTWQIPSLIHLPGVSGGDLVFLGNC